MSAHQDTPEVPHSPVAFGAAVAGQMRSSSDHSPTSAKSAHSAQSGIAPPASAGTSVHPPRKADNLPSTSVAQAIAQRLSGKE
jgi:hypothetical protein